MFSSKVSSTSAVSSTLDSTIESNTLVDTTIVSGIVVPVVEAVVEGADGSISSTAATTTPRKRWLSGAAASTVAGTELATAPTSGIYQLVASATDLIKLYPGSAERGAAEALLKEAGPPKKKTADPAVENTGGAGDS